MSVPTTVTINENTLALAGVLDDESVLAVALRTNQWLCNSAPQNCCIDLSLITYSSSAGVAMLLGCVRTARAQNKHLTILPLPKNILALAKVGGLDKLFN